MATKTAVEIGPDGRLVAVEKEAPQAPMVVGPTQPAVSPAHAEVEGAMGEQHRVIAKMEEDLAKAKEKLDGLVHQHNKLPKPLPEGMDTLRVSRADPSFKTNRG